MLIATLTNRNGKLLCFFDIYSAHISLRIHNIEMLLIFKQIIHALMEHVMGRRQVVYFEISSDDNFSTWSQCDIDCM